MSEASNNDTWSMVDFNVPSHEVELVSDLLWSLGVVAIEERNTSSDQVVLRTSMGDDPTESVSAVVAAFPSVATEFIHIPRAVADTWRAHATATKVNESLSLVPAWLQPEGSGEHLFIEPLDTFGLGNHPTTVLALRLALRTTRRGSSVFDLGCGSGVLAVGLAKLLQCSVLAYDIADNARQAVQMNCAINDVATVQWHHGIIGTNNDVVLANILAPVLIDESDAIMNATLVGGTIVLSGMRDEQVERVKSHFLGCTEVDKDSLDGWTAVVLRREM